MHDALERSIRATGQEHHALVHAVGIMPDHVHVVISIPPSIAVSTLIGRLKGSSSHLLNNRGPMTDGVPFAWQGEYGVLSFHEKDLAGVMDYVNNQPARHAAGRLSTTMESLGEDRSPLQGALSVERGAFTPASGRRHITTANDTAP
jgi:putative transposase